MRANFLIGSCISHWVMLFSISLSQCLDERRRKVEKGVKREKSEERRMEKEGGLSEKCRGRRDEEVLIEESDDEEREGD